MQNLQTFFDLKLGKVFCDWFVNTDGIYRSLVYVDAYLKNSLLFVVNNWDMFFLWPLKNFPARCNVLTAVYKMCSARSMFYLVNLPELDQMSTSIRSIHKW